MEILGDHLETTFQTSWGHLGRGLNLLEADSHHIFFLHKAHQDSRIPRSSEQPVLGRTVLTCNGFFFPCDINFPSVPNLSCQLNTELGNAARPSVPVGHMSWLQCTTVPGSVWHHGASRNRAQSKQWACGVRLRMWARGWVFMSVCILLTSALGSITCCWLSYSKRCFSLPESRQLYPLTFSLEGNISSSQVHGKLSTTAGDLALLPLGCALTSWLRHYPPRMTVSLIWQPPTLHGLRLHEILFFH